MKGAENDAPLTSEFRFISECSVFTFYTFLRSKTLTSLKRQTKTYVKQFCQLQAVLLPRRKATESLPTVVQPSHLVPRLGTHGVLRLLSPDAFMERMIAQTVPPSPVRSSLPLSVHAPCCLLFIMLIQLNRFCNSCP
jgi:hypothetical protein